MDEYGTHLEKMKAKAIDARRGGLILVLVGAVLLLAGMTLFNRSPLFIAIGIIAAIVGAVRIGIYKRREDDITAQILKHGSQETV
jgi:O-antigen ligase